MINRAFKSSFIALCIFVGAGIVIYANSLDVPFYLDDYRNISENPSVRIHSISWDTLKEAAFNSPLRTRPVANVSFALNYFFHQENVFGYHVVNIFLHVLVGFTLFSLFSATLETPALKEEKHNVNIQIAPLLASLLWFVHPLHTGSVTYIVQRMIVLSALFFMVSLLCYVKGRLTQPGKDRLLWYGCSFLSALLALGSKEIAATLPFCILIYEWFFFQELDKRWLNRKIWIICILLIFVAGLYIVYGGNLDNLLSGYKNRSFTLGERVLTEFRVVLFYVGLLAFPRTGRLNLDHYIPVSHSLLDPVTTLVSFLVILSLLLFSFLAAKKQRVLAFAILWYLGNLVIESSVLGLELVFEHRTYLPSIFITFAFVYLTLKYVKAREVTVGVLIGIIVLFSYWTYERNGMWKDPVLFWSDSAAKSPEKPRPFMNLSVALRDRGDIEGAIRASQKAIQVGPRFVNAYIGLGAALEKKGDLRGAEEQYLMAREMKTDYAKVHGALGVLYAKQGRMKESIQSFNENLRLAPRDINALVNRASTLAYQGKYPEAIADFIKAIQKGGSNPDIYFNLAVAYASIGELNKAIEAFEEVIRLNPGDRQAREGLRKMRALQNK